jgi:cytochrome c peroxidase
MKTIRKISGLFWIVIVLSSCTKNEEIEEKTPPASFQGLVVPPHFPQPHYNFQNNPITKEGFELGRSLFYDPILSIDSTISCGSCHAQVHAFADHGTTVSTGVGGALGKRNSPTIQNMAWYTSFMWDGGINHIEVMPFAPITSSIEMGETMLGVQNKLQAHPTYPARFQEAFGSEEISSQKILYALAQFMSMMVSADSKYDKVLKGETSFDARELQGYQLFQQKCATCHAEPLLTDFSFRNNGMLEDYSNDEGRSHISKDPQDFGKFKVPTLRNVTLSHPYMHDGSIRHLTEVIDMYSNGVHQHFNTDPLLAQPFNFSEEEKEALLYFLYTLEDYTFLGNHELSEQ